MTSPAERALPTTDRAGGGASGLPPRPRLVAGETTTGGAGRTPRPRPDVLPEGVPAAAAGKRRPSGTRKRAPASSGNGSARGKADRGTGRDGRQGQPSPPPARPAPPVASPLPASPSPASLPAASPSAAPLAAAAPVGGPPAPPARHRDRDLAPDVRRIVHLDVDAFLASVEEALHPELAGLPLVIGGMPHERNLVMSCSYAARAFGVRPGMPLGEAARRCPRAVFRRGDSQAANRMRERVARLLCGRAPVVEVASIDDFFVDLTGTARLQGAAFDVAVALRAAIRAELALPVTIGVATSKTVARIAGKLAKPGGVAEILPGEERALLAHLPIGVLPGAGGAVGGALERFAIRRVGELALVPREVLYASFGRLGLVLHERARAVDREPVEPTHALDGRGELVSRAPRSIRRDSTFEPEEGRREIVEAMLAYLVERASHRLRAHRVAARTLVVRQIHVETRARAHGDGAGAAVERRLRLEPATDATDVLWERARGLLRSFPRRRALVKRVGLSLEDLAPRAGWQRHLFDERADDEEPDATSDAGTLAREGRAPEPREGRTLEPRESRTLEPRESRIDRLRRLDDVLDRLRERHGFGRVLRGTSFALAPTHELGPDGFRLRTPSLNQ